MAKKHLPCINMEPVLLPWQPDSYSLTYPNEIRHGYQQVSLLSMGAAEEDELLMCSDSFRVSKCRLCVKQGAECLWSSCSCVCGLHSYPPVLACQSIKWWGPVPHQGATHDCLCLYVQKFAPPRRQSLLRGKESSVREKTAPIHNDRCSVQLKRMCRRLNSKYMRRHWHTTGISVDLQACLIIKNHGTPIKRHQLWHFWGMNSVLIMGDGCSHNYIPGFHNIECKTLWNFLPVYYLLCCTGAFIFVLLFLATKELCWPVTK